MNQLVTLNESGFMNSLNFLNEIINPARLSAGEPEVKNTNFSARIEDELDELPAVKIIYRFGNEMRTYDLTIDQMTLIGMRESKSVRRSILEILKRIDKPKLPQTYAEALLEAGRLALENEKQAEQLRLAAPKVEFVDKYVEKMALQTATQVAATFGMSAVKMNKLIDEIGGVYDKRIKRSRAFCSDWIAKGYGETKQNEQGYSSSLFTPAGIMRVTEIFTSEGVI